LGLDVRPLDLLRFCPIVAGSGGDPIIVQASGRQKCR
jgi:hypothetical protein